MQELFIKEKEKVLKKRKQRFLAKKKAVSEIFKTMGTQMPT
jgi:hypothetical protein